MSYTVKIKGAKKTIEGSYIPKGHTCECKSCDFKIEVPTKTDEKVIKGLIEFIKNI